MALIKRLKNNSGSDKFILTRTIANLEYYYVPNHLWAQVLSDDDLMSDISNGDIIVNNGSNDLSATDGVDWMNTFINSSSVDISSEPPFVAKVIDGKKLYQRVEGADFAVTTGDANLDFIVPYAECKFTGLEVLNGEIGDKVVLQILDTDAGTVSGVPNYVLNTFAGKHNKVNVAKDKYVRESKYDADLFAGLYIRVIFTSISAKTVYINYVLHELKA